MIFTLSGYYYNSCCDQWRDNTQPAIIFIILKVIKFFTLMFAVKALSHSQVKKLIHLKISFILNKLKTYKKMSKIKLQGCLYWVYCNRWLSIINFSMGVWRKVIGYQIKHFVTTQNSGTASSQYHTKKCKHIWIIYHMSRHAHTHTHTHNTPCILSFSTLL